MRPGKWFGRTRVLFAAALTLGTACTRTSISTLTEPYDPPRFSGATAGLHRQAIQVELVPPTTSGIVRYTFDGAAAITDDAAWTEYTVPVQVNESRTIRAYAFETIANPSPIAATEYVLQVPDPELSEAPGTYGQASLDIELSCPLAGATIRYTLDGSDPTAASPAYTTGSPLTISGGDVELRARAFRTGWTPSEAVGGLYDLPETGIFTIELLMPDGTIAVGGNSANLVYGIESMTVTATASAEISAPAYAWYLNGAVVAGATGASIIVGATGPAGILVPGFYTLTVEAVDGGYSYSETINFEVVAP